MKLRTVLLMTASAVVMAGPPAQAGEVYLSVVGGPNWIPSETIFTTNLTTAFFDFDTGYVIGGAVGVHLDSWAPGLRAEAEVAYRHNKIDGNFVTSGATTGNFDGSIENFSVMANVWYEFDIGSKVRPYIGGGLGWARAHNEQFWTTAGDPTYFTTATSHSGFAFQLGVGLNYEVATGVDLGVGYRYFDGPTIHLYNGDWGPGDQIDNTAHSIAVNLSVDVF